MRREEPHKYLCVLENDRLRAPAGLIHEITLHFRPDQKKNESRAYVCFELITHSYKNKQCIRGFANKTRDDKLEPLSLEITL